MLRQLTSKAVVGNAHSKASEKNKPQDQDADETQRIGETQRSAPNLEEGAMPSVAEEGEPEAGEPNDSFSLREEMREMAGHWYMQHATCTWG